MGARPDLPNPLPTASSREGVRQDTNQPEQQKERNKKISYKE